MLCHTKDSLETEIKIYIIRNSITGITQNSINVRCRIGNRPLETFYVLCLHLEARVWETTAPQELREELCVEKMSQAEILTAPHAQQHTRSIVWNADAQETHSHREAIEISSPSNRTRRRHNIRDVSRTARSACVVVNSGKRPPLCYCRKLQCSVLFGGIGSVTATEMSALQKPEEEGVP